MQVQFLYGNKIASREQLHQLLSEQLHFPSYYGKNLDALYDCLSERSTPLQLIISEKDALCENLLDYGSKFLQVLEDCQAENPQLHIEYR